MKIIAKPPKTAESVREQKKPVTLTDYKQDIWHGVIRGLGGRMMELVDYPGGLAKVVFDRGNKDENISFETTRIHENIDAAEIFFLKHNEEIPAIADIEFHTDRGTYKMALLGAGISAVERSYKGCRTTHSYQIIGGKFTKLS